MLFSVVIGSPTVDSQSADSLLLEEPQAIPLIKVSRETERTREKISRATSRMLSQQDILDVKQEFLDATDDFDRAIEGYEQFRSVTPNKLKLDNYIRKWRSLSDARIRWRSALEAVMSRADISRQMLESEKEKWALTRELAVESNTTSPVISSIDNTIDRLDRALEEVNSQLSLSLETSAEIAEQKSTIDEIVTDLEEWSSSGELHAFYQRHPPIWNTAFNLRDTGARAKLQTAGDHVQTAQRYYSNFGGEVETYLIITLLMMALIFYLQRRLKDTELNESEDSLSRVRGVIENSTIPTAIYFAAVFALFYLQNIPSLIASLLLLAVLVCSLTLLRPFTLKAFYFVIPFVILAFALDTMKSYIWFSSAGYRLYMYAEAILGLSVTVYYVRAMGLANLDKNLINRIFRVGSYVLVVLFIGSILANSLGYTNLSDIFLRLCIMGSTITVIAYGILFVLGGVIGTSLTIYFAEHTEFSEATSKLILKRTQSIVKWIAGFIWLMFLLVSAELYRPLLTGIELWLTEPWVMGTFSLTPGALLTFVLVIVIAFVLARTIALMIEGGVLNFLRIPGGTLAIISMLLRYFIVAMAFAIALATLGIDLGKFGLMAGALGVGIGFGLQNIVANFIAGMILTFEQPLSPGDTVEINNKLGVVQKVGVRSSILRSFDGADIVIPNATLLSNDLINWTRVDDQKRIELNIGVAYGSDPKQVRNILMQIVSDHPSVLDKPEPMALFNQFGDSALNFRLLFWSPISEWMDIQSEVAGIIYERFAEEGIEIPFPQQDVWIRQAVAEESESTNSGDAE